MTDKTKAIDVDEKGLIAQTPQDLEKPRHDTEFAQASAKLLVNIIKQNNWSRRLGGQSEHISYEGWQTAGKYYGYSVKTFDAEYVEYGSTWGFKAKAVVVNENTGIEVGGAEAYCMNDEGNWRNKPKFQLASMAQTRAGSKALRQILGFVVALAGYSPTPIEEMTGNEYADNHTKVQHTNGDTPNGTTNGNGHTVSEKQLWLIRKLLGEKGFTENQLMQKYDVTALDQLTKDQASTIIENLMKLPVKS